MNNETSESNFRFFAGVRIKRQTPTHSTDITFGVGYAGQKSAQSTQRQVRERQTSQQYVFHKAPQQYQPQQIENSQMKVRKTLPLPMEKIECKYCHGIGRRGDGHCPVCGGAKYIRVPINSVECGNCYGLARRSEKVCEACQGSTRVTIREFH